MYKNIYNSLYFKKSLGLKIQEMTFSVKCYSKHIKLHFDFDCLQIFSKYCFKIANGIAIAKEVVSQLNSQTKYKDNRKHSCFLFGKHL